MADIIIGLIGGSGSGKTTIAKELEELGYNIIHSYTTRSPRYNTEWGHTFVKEEDVKFNFDFDTAEVTHKGVTEPMIAYVFYNNNHYWATESQCEGKSIYVIDPEGLSNLKKWSPFPVLGIFLNAEEWVREQRMSFRGDSQEKIRDRIQNDRKAFSVSQTDWVVDANDDVGTILKRVVKILNK